MQSYAKEMKPKWIVGLRSEAGCSMVGNARKKLRGETKNDEKRNVKTDPFIIYVI